MTNKPIDSLENNITDETNNVLSDIQRIALSIKKDRKLEDDESVVNKAVASYEVIINGQEFTLWLVNGEITSGISFTQDFYSSPVIVKSKSLTLKRSGQNKTISKNSKMAGHLIMSENSDFSFNVGDQLNAVLLLSKADYNPFNSDGNATNITIRFKKEQVYYRYKSLRDILEEIDSKKREITELEKLKAYYFDDEDEIQKCIEKQRKVENDLNELYRKKQAFIIEHARLRYKAILDPMQEKIKRNNFYDNSLMIIDGGPGTGKTTTLIQRIKYLIDPVVIEEYNDHFLNQEKIKILNENEPTWIFFSPNELLYLYLTESMTREGLKATSETGKVWNQYRKELFWKYDLSNKKTKEPFVLYRNDANEALFESNGESFTKIKSEFIKALNEEFIKNLNDIIQNISTNTRKTSSELKRYIIRKSISNLNSAITLCSGISQNFGDQIQKYKEQYESQLEKLATILKGNIIRDIGIVQFMQIKFSEIYSVQYLIGSNFLTEVDKLFGYNSFDSWLFNYSKNIIKTAAAYIIQNNFEDFKKLISTNMIENIFSEVIKYEVVNKFSEEQKEWEILSKFEDSTSYLILDKIAISYLKFRTSNNGLIKLEHVNKDLYAKLIQSENNRLHSNEQSFLIGIINEILKRIHQTSKAEYTKIRHKYKDAYEKVSKMVIAIDEVIDFHIFDLYGIFSLSDKDKYSLTASGDIMQRIEDSGINNWEDLKTISSSLNKYELGISYRQSYTLLKLAQIIYEESISEKFKVRAYFEKYENEPKPIYKISTNEDKKIRWIANKILEIYDFYGGEMPSVAIFLSKEDNIDEFSNKLREIDDLADVGIDIKACKNGEVLGSGSVVRVFSLKYIKGLEFEAVIFHNLDDIIEDNNKYRDSILKKVYVGLSRATFYVAATISKEWHDDLNFLTEGFSNEDNWQIQNKLYV